MLSPPIKNGEPEYAGCTDNSRVVHYKVNGADHIWMMPNNDIYYTREIWKFFIGQSPTNLSPLGVNELPEDGLISIYPNPANGVFSVSNVNGKIDQVDVFDTAGRLMLSFSDSFGNMNVSSLEAGVYILNIHVEDRIVSKRIAVQ